MNRKTLSRTRARVMALLCCPAVVLVAAGAVTAQALLWGLGSALLVVFCILFLAWNRCPHCGAPFRGLHPFAPDAGYCCKCGKKMEFDR